MVSGHWHFQIDSKSIQHQRSVQLLRSTPSYLLQRFANIEWPFIEYHTKEDLVIYQFLKRMGKHELSPCDGPQAPLFYLRTYCCIA